MPDESADRPGVLALLLSAEQRLSEARGIPDEHAVGRVLQLLREVEQATPGGAGLHTQLDTVAKWVRLLAQPAEHGRFGGSAHVRDHLAMQFRLAAGAAEDYLRAVS